MDGGLAAGHMAQAPSSRGKRLLDLAGAALLILASLPLWAVLAAAIKLADGGPVFYRFRVVGLGGREFHALKFRTMTPGADEELQGDAELWAAFEERFKLRDDPRITPLGRTLRRLSLDELPQAWNVLKGEMSLVGPRACAPYELKRYGHQAQKRLSVRPGMTGLWQVSGRHELSYQQRIELDLHYIDHWSLGLDLQILLRTLPAILSMRGAH